MAFLLTTGLVVAVLASCAIVYVLSESLSSSSQNLKSGPLVKPTVEPLPASVLPDQASVLSSQSLPSNRNYIPEVGNGHLATVVHSDSVFMNGLYNGANFSSHRARISSTAGYSISSTSPAGLSRLYSLDVGRGIFQESYSGPGVSITLRTYAHRQLTRVLVTELLLTRQDPSTPVEVTLTLNPGPPSPDVDLQNETQGTIHGRTREAEYPELAPPTDFYMLTSPSLQGKIVMSSGRLAETYLSLTVIDVNRDKVLGEYASAIQAFTNNTLLSSHAQCWSLRWQQASIDLEGDLHVSRINYASLYYILSSLPWTTRQDWPFVGLSPGGLAHGAQGKDYLGHIFWDQDTWMFPPIALLHPDLGRIIVQTRTRTLSAARRLARDTGYQGARFPWESAFTGLETCPAWPYAKFEIHINGDVALMMRQFWQLTRDSQFMLNQSGAELVWEIARFWASRVSYNKSDGTYRIYDVMPPDEYHMQVNDSAYTNQIAALSLNFANSLRRTFGLPENQTWADISRRLYHPYDPVLDYHPEFSSFQPDLPTKQADVVLLAFPLMVEMNQSTRANDLRAYEKVTPIGPAPAMTWGMFLLGWLDLGQEVKAAELFVRSILNVQQPFYVWSENSDGGGAVNFHTGMGGYLQSVLFGYGGIRLYDEFMTFNPKLINGTSRMTLKGINYRDCTLNIQYTAIRFNLTLTSVQSGKAGLQVQFENTSNWQDLLLLERVEKGIQSFKIRSQQQR